MNRKQRRGLGKAGRGAPTSVSAQLLAHAGQVGPPIGVPGKASPIEVALRRHKAGDLDGAEAAYRRLLEENPEHPRALHLLGLVLHQRGRPAEAVELIGKSIELDPRDPEAHNNLGNALRKLGRIDEAVARYRQAIACHPRFAGAYSNLGLALRQEGRMAEAVAAFRQALAIDPNLPEAYNGLARTGRFAEQPPEIEKMEALLARGGLLAGEKRVAHFTLAKYYDDCGHYDRAFDNARAANALKGCAFDAAAHRRLVDRIIASFPAHFLRREHTPPPYPSPEPGSAGVSPANAPWGEEREGVKPIPIPIFVFGMPRSGTTLVEQILASHPLVFGAGELNVIEREAERLGFAAGPPTSEAVAGLRECFLEALSERGGSATHVVDKSPFNFLWLGVIALAFPAARLVHCTRDAEDTCLSIYFTDFTLQRPFTADLKSIGLYYREYERLMAHWRRVLPGSVLNVVYEDLVANQETSTRTLLDHCGLPWDERCLAYFKTERQVATPSDWQVRLPLYATSVGRARHYEAHLGPLREGLAGAV